jgi:hypothetical protein
MRLEEMIADAKETEVADGVLMLSDSSLCQVLLAFKHVAIELNRPADVTCWKHAWGCCRFDYDELGALAGVSIGECRLAIRRLSGLGLIYPDGTINQFADKYLKGLTAKRIREIGK